MRTLSVKQQNELAAFVRFVERLGTHSEWLNISNRPEREPDLLCVHVTQGPIAFELVSLTDPVIAKVQAAGSKALQGTFSTSDPSERIIRKKLHSRYNTSARHIELLVYTDGQIMTTDDQIVLKISPWLDAIKHPFKKIWFMGQFKTCCLWHAD